MTTVQDFPDDVAPYRLIGTNRWHDRLPCETFDRYGLGIRNG